MPTSTLTELTVAAVNDLQPTAREILNPMGGLSGIKERDRPVEQNGYQKTGEAHST